MQVGDGCVAIRSWQFAIALLAASMGLGKWRRVGRRANLSHGERKREIEGERECIPLGWSAGRLARDNAMQWKSSATPYRGLVYTNHRPMEAIILICWPSIELLSWFPSRIIKVARGRGRSLGRHLAGETLRAAFATLFS